MMKRKIFIIIGILLICIIMMVVFMPKNNTIDEVEREQILEITTFEIGEAKILEDNLETNILNESKETDITQVQENNQEQNNIVQKKNKESVKSNNTKVSKQPTEEKTKSSYTGEKETTVKEQNNNKIIQQDKNNQIAQTINLSKYNFYEKQPNGTYKGFIEDQAEINKLKGLIDSAINNFGYKNMKVVLDSSLAKSGTMYFTANKTNVENVVYNSEGFGIYYYAIKEYYISANGTETFFQTRSYIKVK